MKKKIFCFVAAVHNIGLESVALCEDGEVLASHLSSNESFARRDMGVEGTQKHDIYAEHCPDGFEVVWCDDDRVTAELEEDNAGELYDAWMKNQALRDEE